MDEQEGSMAVPIRRSLKDRFVTWMVKSVVPEIDWWTLSLGPSLGYHEVQLPIFVFFWERKKIAAIRLRRESQKTQAVCTRR